jgi:hypothetical protein
MIKNSIFRKWILIVIFSLGGAVIGASIAYFYQTPKIKYVADIALRAGVDQNRAMYEITAILPKCSVDNVQSSKVTLIQTISNIKASPGLMALSVEGGDKISAENCLNKSVKFILTYQNSPIDTEVNDLQEEIVAIDQALSMRKANNNSLKFSDDSYSAYPQELLLRKYKILREIYEVKKGSARVLVSGLHQSSFISFVLLKFLIGAMFGFLVGVAIIFWPKLIPNDLNS